MDVSSTTSTTSATTAPSAAAATTQTESKEVVSSDFQTFLTMLTVQMQNQDPMNPMDSTDFAVQLATFSGVEQQVKTNDLLEAMRSQLGAMSMSDLAGWVGMEASAVSPAWFSGTPLTLQPDPASGSERTYVVVYNAQGVEVDRAEIPVSDDPVRWAGVSALGEPYPEGLYSFYLESRSAGEVLSLDQMAVYSEVVEARVERGATILVLAGGSEVSAEEVGALRAPQTATDG